MTKILITGPPGIGKTTIVKKVIDELRLKGTEYNGFYTEEVRGPVSNNRLGFDVVTMEGSRAILARKDENVKNLPMVGQYAVHINDFEEIVLPIISNPKPLMIIDEIGKMEMFSKKFEECVRNLFNNKDINILATVPVKGGPLLVKHLKERNDCILFTINRVNRNNIFNDIVSKLQDKNKS